MRKIRGNVENLENQLKNSLKLSFLTYILIDKGLYYCHLYVNTAHDDTDKSRHLSRWAFAVMYCSHFDHREVSSWLRTGKIIWREL